MLSVSDETCYGLACEHDELKLVSYILELALAVIYFENYTVNFKKQLSCKRVVDKARCSMDLPVLNGLRKTLRRVALTDDEDGLILGTVNLKVSRSSLYRIDIAFTESALLTEPLVELALVLIKLLLSVSYGTQIEKRESVDKL